MLNSYLYCREFGSVPLTTTALSTRDIERTRRLLLPGDTDVMPGFMLLNLLWYHGLIDQIKRSQGKA